MMKIAAQRSAPLESGLLLANRAGLPDDMLFLARAHPRADWPARLPLAQTAAAWLHFHDGFRRAAATLSADLAALREGQLTPAAFAPRFGALASRFVAGLEGHHGVEDDYYFPTFADAEPRLRRGFEILDSDHDAVHSGLEHFDRSAAALLRASPADAITLGSEGQFAAEGLDRDWSSFRKSLLRHLEDEEDIVVPLMIELASKGKFAA